MTDFIGISSYASLTPNFTIEKLESATEQFVTEVSSFGVDIPDLIFKQVSFYPYCDTSAAYLAGLVRLSTMPPSIQACMRISSSQMLLSHAIRLAAPFQHVCRCLWTAFILRLVYELRMLQLQNCEYVLCCRVSSSFGMSMEWEAAHLRMARPRRQLLSRQQPLPSLEFLGSIHTTGTRGSYLTLMLSMGRVPTLTTFYNSTIDYLNSGGVLPAS